jgi:hypothetical protein
MIIERDYGDETQESQIFESDIKVTYGMTDE